MEVGACRGGFHTPHIPQAQAWPSQLRTLWAPHLNSNSTIPWAHYTPHLGPCSALKLSSMLTTCEFQLHRQEIKASLNWTCTLHM